MASSVQIPRALGYAMRRQGQSMPDQLARPAPPVKVSIGRGRARRVCNLVGIALLACAAAANAQATTKDPTTCDVRSLVGMPALDSVTGVTELRKGKKVFHVIHTDEVDAYEQAPLKAMAKKP